MNKKILLTIIIVISFFLGFFMSYYISIHPQKVKTPLPNMILNNPMLKSLYANIEGKLAEKNKDYMILTKNGIKTTIYLSEDNGLTSFKIKKGNRFENIEYEDIPTGSYLSGGISVNLEKNTTSDNHHKLKIGDVIGHSFILNPDKNKP